MTVFKIHPAIGIARLGNSDTDFYLAPESPGQLPTEYDVNGQEKPVEQFRDSQKRIKRQAARFRVYVYDSDNEAGREIKIGDTFEFLHETSTTAPTAVNGKVTDIEWTVHLANKKASWYTFKQTEGQHGYPADHPLRNAAITNPQARRNMIIDPGPQTVSWGNPKGREKPFAAGSNPGYPQTFPPLTLSPNPITTLGELRLHRQKKQLHLLVLGGFGNSGSTQIPMLTQYANNDGWFDDVADGPVTARIQYEFTNITYDEKGKPVHTKITDYAEANVPAWVAVGYPRYVPQIMDMITLDEAMYDLFVRYFAYNYKLFGVPPFDKAHNNPQTDEDWAIWRAEARWNPNYYPKFYREIWPILSRPDNFQWVYDFDPFEGGVPHNTQTGGDLDQGVMKTPPQQGCDNNQNRQMRQFVYDILRKPGQENMFRLSIDHPEDPLKEPRGMPELCGNNPLSNTAPEKFLRLTSSQLFMLRQWAAGKFVNECAEWAENDKNCQNPWSQPPQTGQEIDRGVLSNVVGGAFCPGAELTWIMLNAAIYSEPYRIKHAEYQAAGLSLPEISANQDGSVAADLAAGLEPGDLTKYMALPWQADFTQCTEQNINVTYANWNNLDLDTTGDPAKQEIAFNVPWWPAHRPIVVNTEQFAPVYWASGIPENDAGMLRMVTGWKDLGFLKWVKNEKGQGYAMVERNSDQLGDPVAPGKRRLGNTKRES